MCDKHEKLKIKNIGKPTIFDIKNIMKILQFMRIQNIFRGVPNVYGNRHLYIQPMYLTLICS